MWQAFADNIIAFHQSNEHIETALPLLDLALRKAKIPIPNGNRESGDLIIRSACAVNELTSRRLCQDIYALLIDLNYRIGNSSRAKEYFEEFNNARPPDRRFEYVELVHRQLPYIAAKPLWIDELHEIQLFKFINHIQGQYKDIKEEVLTVTSKPNFTGWGANLDPRLSTNPSWNPKTSWEAIPLYSDMKWEESECMMFPRTCNILKGFDDDFKILFNRKSYLKMVGKDRMMEGYSEVPTLGIKLYKVWQNAGVKPHMGSPGRLVHSIALVSPENPRSTLTVGGKTLDWVAGEFISFDDSFVHSVQNPSTSEDRIVLAFVTIHPDLLMSRDEGNLSKNSLINNIPSTMHVPALNAGIERNEVEL